MVENLTKDRQGGNRNRQHQYGIEELNEIKQSCNLIDIWRTQNKFKTQFTYKNDILDFKSRKDRFYIWNHTRKNFSIWSDIVPNTLSDHHMISFSLTNVTRNKRGPSYWKLNTSIYKIKKTNKKYKPFGYIGKIRKTFIPTKLKGGIWPKRIYNVLPKTFV